MRVRRRRLVSQVALAATAMAGLAAMSGCGGTGVSTAGTPTDQLTIYSSLPLHGPLGAASQQIVNGEKLALAQSRGRVGRLRITYASLDDSNPQTGEWAPGLTATNAKIAAQDTSTIAYLGDYESAASAVSLPLINAAGILQVSPSSPYVGLTSSLDAGQDEPERFYPSGQRTFARLQPGDPVQAAAEIKLMRALKVKRVYVLSDQDPFDLPLAAIVAEQAKRAGIEVQGEDGVDTTAASEFAGEVHKVIESGAQAVFFSALPNHGAVALFRELHLADPRLRLLGASTLAEPAFAAQLGGADGSTFLSTPVLPPRLYPPVAQGVLREYRRRFHEAPSADALYGYETMSLVLLAIHRARPHGNDRQAVIKRFLAIKDRDSVLGRYSIEPDGETTLSRYGVERVLGGRLVFWRALETA